MFPVPSACIMKVLVYILVTFEFLVGSFAQPYDPTWDSLDKRPIPAWFNDAKFGIFMHLGVWSVPGVGNFFWERWASGDPEVVAFMKANYPPTFTYADFAPDFTMELFDANRWASLFAASGARYVVLTAKHHEGFTNWPSAVSWNWNANDVGPKRDIVGEYVAALRANGKLRVGIYHSMFEWFNPLYLLDATNNYSTQNFVKAKAMPELYELVNKYNPDLIWSDGAWMADSSYWNSTTFLAWLYNQSPVKDTVVVNDRWGSDTACAHGGYWNCNDGYQPHQVPPRKWESCAAMDTGSWVYRRSMTLSSLLSTQQILRLLVRTVAFGGNLLLNVGPRSDGWIDVAFEQRLTEVGQWLQVNGDSIYYSNVWHTQNDSLTQSVYYTTRQEQRNGRQTTTVYGLVTEWPIDNILRLSAPQVSAETQVTLIGYHSALTVLVQEEFIEVILPPLQQADLACFACRYVQVLKFENLLNASK